MLSRLREQEAMEILGESDLRQITPHTTFRMRDLKKKLAEARECGYATNFEEYFSGDFSVAAAVVDPSHRPIAAVSIAVSSLRFSKADVENRFGLLVVAAARSIAGGHVINTKTLEATG
jgi:IclR family pca regulon transcriptional regulator